MNVHSAQFDTPNIRASEAILVLHSSTEINAPASLVFRSLRNTETWRDWNRFVPKVNITYQPPEEDSATAAEIQQIVRNTSIVGSFYSDLTDGGVGPPKQRGPDEQPPPRFRLNSISSQMSEGSHASNAPRMSESIDPSSTSGNGASAPRGSVSSAGGKSGAQMFQEAQERRRSSLASGQEPPPIVNKVENTDNHRASISSPSSSLTSRSRRGSKHTQSASAANSKAAEKAHAAMMSMYGEPSVRLQIKTKVTFYVRMKPYSPSEYTETNMVVTDVSRPDDPLLESGTTALTRSKTHNLERSGMYRVVWGTDSEGASLFKVSGIFSGSKMPKYLLQGERVHEIEPTGPESCIYRTWECQKGKMAKTVKNKHGDYLQKMFEAWAGGLRDFCEGLHAPKIDRRDFSISADEAPIVIQSLV